jgi:prenyltransferase beta subunit
MRLRFALLVCLVPGFAVAQTPAIDSAVKEKLATLKFIQSLRDPATGAYKVTPDGKPSLRAVNGAVKAIKYLGGKLPELEKTAAFVLSCYDPKTGAFAEPGGKPDVAITSIGVIAAAELGVPKEKYAKALDYLKANARTFEEVRIGAAALEARGEKPDWVKEWFKIQQDEYYKRLPDPAQNGAARDIGSHVAMRLRLGEPLNITRSPAGFLLAGQRDDGGYSKAGAKGSDLESTYRVMRAIVLMKEKPKDIPAMRKFLTECRNMDGGYGVFPGASSSMSGVYYASIVSKWLDDMGMEK